MSRRKLNARILMVGWRSTKSPRGLASTIIASAAITTAAIMIESWLTIPTAVITESNEKTTSNNRTCTITLTNEALTRAEALPS